MKGVKKMKKLSSFILILALGLFLVYGCQQSNRTTEDTNLPDHSDVATEVGDLMSLSALVDATALGQMGISSIISAGPRAAAPVYTDGWWEFTYTTSTTEGLVVYNFKTQAFTSHGETIEVLEGQSNTDQLNVVADVTWGTKRTYNFGTEDSPLIFDGIGGQGIRSFDGTASVAVTDNQSKRYSITLIYDGVVLDDDGLPREGSASFLFSSNDYATVYATIAINGDQTATLTYTGPSELENTSYRINLENGDVSAASL
jgi:hypothetical protein